MKESLIEQYRASLKSMDTEEHIDLWFYRPMGFLWAKLFARLGFTPNVVTILSIFLGVAGGILLYPRLMWFNVLGMLLIIWANTYDSADGQLARMTKQYSRLGRILDGLSGDLWFVAIYFALVFRELAFGDRWPVDYFSTHAWAIWTLAIAAGLCHAKQSASADYYRQFHLYFLKGEAGSELDDTAQLDENYRQVTWRGHFWSKLTMMFYRNYTAQQEAHTPAMQRLRRLLAERWPGQMPPQRLRDDFRHGSLPLMKYTNMLSFNTRIIAMFVSVLIDMPWLYFAFELVVLNLMLVYMIVCHERLCRRMIGQINNGVYEGD